MRLPVLSLAAVSISSMMLMIIWIMLMMIPLTTIVHAQEGDDTVEQPCEESHEYIKDLIFDVWGYEIDGGHGEEHYNNDDDDTFYCEFGKSSFSGGENDREAKSKTMTCFFGIPNYYYASVRYTASGYDDYDSLEPELLAVTTTYYINGTDTESDPGQIIIDFAGGSNCFDSSEAPAYFDAIKYRIENPNDIEIPLDYPNFSPPSSFPSDIPLPLPPSPIINNEFCIKHCIPPPWYISSEGEEYIHNCKMEVTDTIDTKKNVTTNYVAINAYDKNDKIVVENVYSFNYCTADDLLNAEQTLQEYFSKYYDDSCNQHDEIVDLLKATFRDEENEERRCFPASSMTSEGQGAFTLDCEMEVTYEIGSAKTVTAYYIAINVRDDNGGGTSIIPNFLNVSETYIGGSGSYELIPFVNDCTKNNSMNAEQILEKYIVNPLEDCNNQLSQIISLMEDTFGIENCNEFSSFPQDVTVTCTIEDGTGRGTISAKLIALYNEDDIAIPGAITIEYGGGIVGTQPVIEFSNDCTGDDLRNAQDLLKDIEPQQTDIACNSHSNVTSLLEDNFGAKNCVESVPIDNEATWICSSETTEGIVKITTTATYTASDVGGSFFSDTFNVVSTLQEGEGGFSGSFSHDFVNDCTPTDIYEITKLLGLEEECPGQYEIVTLLEGTFGEENCEFTESSTGFTWVCKRRIDHKHAFKGVVDEVWIATYESKFPSGNSAALPYNLKLESLTVFEEGDLYNDENSDLYTIDSIDFVNNCTTVDINKTKDLLKWVTTEKEDIIDDSPWSDYFYCVWAHWFDKEKCSA